MKRARLELDLIAPARRARWPGYALLCAALAAGAATFERYRDATLALQRVEVAMELRPPARAHPRAPRMPLDEKSARAAAQQLGLPWAGVIDALERAATPDVALLQIQPQAQQRTITIGAEARHRDAMFRYLHALSKTKGLSRVHLVSEQTQLDDAQMPIRFSAQASFGAMQ